MELRHLRYFVAVAELQNITRAAAKLHVSQDDVSIPVLPRLIRRLAGTGPNIDLRIFPQTGRSPVAEGDRWDLLIGWFGST